MERIERDLRCHGPGGDGGPGFAVEAEAAVELVADVLGVLGCERHEGGGDEAGYVLDDDTDLLQLVVQVVGGCEGVDRAVRQGVEVGHCGILVLVVGAGGITRRRRASAR